MLEAVRHWVFGSFCLGSFKGLPSLSPYRYACIGEKFSGIGMSSSGFIWALYYHEKVYPLNGNFKFMKPRILGYTTITYHAFATVIYNDFCITLNWSSPVQCTRQGLSKLVFLVSLLLALY